jgi:class 3 adenylate cyclase
VLVTLASFFAGLYAVGSDMPQLVVVAHAIVYGGVFLAHAIDGRGTEQSERSHFSILVEVQKVRRHVTMHTNQVRRIIGSAVPVELVPIISAETNAVVSHESARATVGVADVFDFAQWSTGLFENDVVLVLHRLLTVYDVALRRFGVTKAMAYGDSYVVCAGLLSPCEAHEGNVRRYAKWQVNKVRQNRSTMAQPYAVRASVCTGPFIGGVSGQVSVRYFLSGRAFQHARSALMATAADTVTVATIDDDSDMKMEDVLGPFAANGSSQAAASLRLSETIPASPVSRAQVTVLSNPTPRAGGGSDAGDLSLRGNTPPRDGDVASDMASEMHSERSALPPDDGRAVDIDVELGGGDDAPRPELYEVDSIYMNKYSLQFASPAVEETMARFAMHDERLYGAHTTAVLLIVYGSYIVTLVVERALDDARRRHLAATDWPGIGLLCGAFAIAAARLAAQLRQVHSVPLAAEYGAVALSLALFSGSMWFFVDSLVGPSLVHVVSLAQTHLFRRMSWYWGALVFTVTIFLPQSVYYAVYVDFYPLLALSQGLCFLILWIVQYRSEHAFRSRFATAEIAFQLAETVDCKAKIELELLMTLLPPHVIPTACDQFTHGAPVKHFERFQDLCIVQVRMNFSDAVRFAEISGAWSDITATVRGADGLLESCQATGDVFLVAGPFEKLGVVAEQDRILHDTVAASIAFVRALHTVFSGRANFTAIMTVGDACGALLGASGLSFRLFGACVRESNALLGAAPVTLQPTAFAAESFRRHYRSHARRPGGGASPRVKTGTNARSVPSPFVGSATSAPDSQEMTTVVADFPGATPPPMAPGPGGHLPPPNGNEVNPFVLPVPPVKYSTNGDDGDDGRASDADVFGTLTRWRVRGAGVAMVCAVVGVGVAAPAAPIAALVAVTFDVTDAAGFDATDAADPGLRSQSFANAAIPPK